jgi:gluconate 2-dehydrogenase gamma chain
METRREALKIIGAIGATCSFPFSANELYGQHIHQANAENKNDNNSNQPFEPRFFTQTEFESISRVADLIIPATDTPGAIAAGVPQYIDLVVSADLRLQEIFRSGLQDLDSVSRSKFGNTFMHLSEAQQVEILKALHDDAERERGRKQGKVSDDAGFFQSIKNLTADGYYTSRVGLLQELGYNGNAVLLAFPEFAIPEH